MNEIPRELNQLLATPGVTDVILNGHQQSFVDSGRGLEPVPDPFPTMQKLRSVIADLAFQAGARWDISQPFADFVIAGNRFHAVLGGNLGCPDLLSIRTHPVAAASLEQLHQLEMIDDSRLRQLRTIVTSGDSFLIAGPTGSGKTTLLTAMLAESKSRVVAIEDIAELRLLPPSISMQVRRPNIEGKGSISATELLSQALRMRPDRIVVGEIRGAEFFSLLQAVNNGHAGACATVHAAQLSKLRDRLITLGLISGLDQMLTEKLLRAGIDWVIQLQRVENVRKVSAIARLEDLFTPLRSAA